MVVKVTSRTRATSAKSTPAKPAAKKAPAKKAVPTAPATKTTSRATPTRARKADAPEVQDVPARRATAKKAAPSARATKTVVPDHVPLQERRAQADPKKRVAGLTYKQISELTGYGLGSEQFIAAVEVLRGASTKLEVNQRVKLLLPETTRNGTPKQVSNLVSGVIGNLTNRGFEVVGTWKMVPPKSN